MMMATFEIDRVQYPDVIAMAFEHCATFGQDGPFRIGHHIAGMHLHQIGLDKEPCFSRTRATNHQHIFVSGVLGILRAAVHGERFGFG